MTVDADTCTARFRVEYHSQLPAGQHDAIHEEINSKAQELLRKFWGDDGAALFRCEVEIVVWWNTAEDTIREQPAPCCRGCRCRECQAGRVSLGGLRIQVRRFPRGVQPPHLDGPDSQRSHGIQPDVVEAGTALKRCDQLVKSTLLY